MADNRAEHNRPARELSDLIGQLERRIAALERAAAEPSAEKQPFVRPAPVEAVGRSAPAEASGGPDSNQHDAAEQQAPPAGQVSYSGTVTLHGRVVWDIALGAQNVLKLPNTRSSGILAGLGHPTRAALTRRLLSGPATTAELQQVVDGSSTGQLYHHLRTLTACGLAEQDGRGQYRVPSTAVVPALVLLLAAADIAGDLR